MPHSFYVDPYRKEITGTTIVAIQQQHHGIVLADSLFFPKGGGQPGDKGAIYIDNLAIPVLDTIKDPDSPEQCCLLLSKECPLPGVHTLVKQAIEWSYRYPIMQMHTALHLLCASLSFGVTGGGITPAKSRIDFDTSGEPMPDKLEISDRINHLIQQNLTVQSLWMDWAFLDQHPDIVRTLKVQPPRNSQKLRMIRIGDENTPVDLQPCGGTHVRSTAEIPTIEVSKIENKGQHNKRVSILFAS